MNILSKKINYSTIFITRAVWPKLFKENIDFCRNMLRIIKLCTKNQLLNTWDWISTGPWPSSEPDDSDSASACSSSSLASAWFGTMTLRSGLESKGSITGADGAATGVWMCACIWRNLSIYGGQTVDSLPEDMMLSNCPALFTFGVLGWKPNRWPNASRGLWSEGSVPGGTRWVRAGGGAIEVGLGGAGFNCARVSGEKCIGNSWDTLLGGRPRLGFVFSGAIGLTPCIKGISLTDFFTALGWFSIATDTLVSWTRDPPSLCLALSSVSHSHSRRSLCLSMRWTRGRKKQIITSVWLRSCNTLLGTWLWIFMGRFFCHV